MNTFGRKPVPDKPVLASTIKDTISRYAYNAGLPADRSGKSQAQGSLAYKRAQMHRKGRRP